MKEKRTGEKIRTRKEGDKRVQRQTAHDGKPKKEKKKEKKKKEKKKKKKKERRRR